MLIEKILLWFFFSLGIFLFIFSFRRPPIKDWLLAFLLTAYLSCILGVIVVEKGMLSYPVSFLKDYFETSLLYEFLLLPVVSIYYFQTTYHAKWTSIFVQGFAYTTVLTIIEVLLERYTNLIHYYTWTWRDSFVSIFLVLFLIRVLLQILKKQDNHCQ